MEWFLNEFETFVGVNFWTMLFAWCNLIILYFVLRKILFRPIKNMIDSRQSEIDGMYTDAENAKESAEVLKAEYEKKLESARDESEQILKSAQKRAQKREEEIIAEAKKEAERTIERAGEQIELEKKRIQNEIKDEVSKIAIDIARAVIERDVSEDEHRELIDSFIDEVGK